MKNLVEYLNESASVLSQGAKDAIKYGMLRGYIPQEENGKIVKYGISRENIFTVAEEFDKKDVEKYIAELEKKGGIKFKFEKDEEWKKAGYEDPNEN